MKKPNKPTKPIEPPETVKVVESCRIGTDAVTVDELLSMMPEGIRQELVEVEVDLSDCYHESDYQNQSAAIRLKWTETKSNPRYTSEMKKYEKALTKYELDKVRYEDNLKAYNAEQKALKVRLDQEQEVKLRKQYEDLKKKFEGT